MQNLTVDSFRIPAVGAYSFEGRAFDVFERLSGFGSGKKTVYSFTCDGVTREHLDINQVKRFFGVSWSGSSKARRASVPAEAPAVDPSPVPSEPVPAPVPESVPAPSGVVRHDKFEYLRGLLSLGISPYLYGPAGSGKNVVCQQLADALGLDFYYSNSVTQEFKVAGFVDAGGRYHETEFFRAFTRGGLFMLDELDASCPEVLTLLNAALANKYFTFEGVGRVNAHPDFYCIAAGNTIGLGADDQYTGRQVIDAATLNRFVPVAFDYCAAVEESIAKNDPAALEFVRGLRLASKACGLSLVLGYRNILHLIKLATLSASGLVPLSEAVYSSCLPGVDVDGIANIRAAWTGNRQNKYFSAL